MLIKLNKHVTSACYDKQHLCTYLQLFWHQKNNSGKITSFKGVPLFDTLVWGETLHPAAPDFITKVLGAAHSEDFVILACTVLIRMQSVTDGQTDRRRGQDVQSILLLGVLSWCLNQSVHYLLLHYRCSALQGVFDYLTSKLNQNQHYIY